MIQTAKMSHPFIFLLKKKPNRSGDVNLNYSNPDDDDDRDLDSLESRLKSQQRGSGQMSQLILKKEKLFGCVFKWSSLVKVSHVNMKSRSFFGRDYHGQDFRGTRIIVTDLNKTLQLNPHSLLSCFSNLHITDKLYIVRSSPHPR